jgi:hypothetical protein
VDGTGSGSCLLMPEQNSDGNPKVFCPRDYLELSGQIHASAILILVSIRSVALNGGYMPFPQGAMPYF